MPGFDSLVSVLPAGGPPLPGGHLVSPLDGGGGGGGGARLSAQCVPLRTRTEPEPELQCSPYLLIIY